MIEVVLARVGRCDGVLYTQDVLCDLAAVLNDAWRSGEPVLVAGADGALCGCVRRAWVEDDELKGEVC